MWYRIQSTRHYQQVIIKTTDWHNAVSAEYINLDNNINLMYQILNNISKKAVRVLIFPMFHFYKKTYHISFEKVINSILYVHCMYQIKKGSGKNAETLYWYAPPVGLEPTTL